MNQADERGTAATFELLDVLDQLQERGQPFYEFLRSGALSAGIYHLAAETPDTQSPHREDEIYYVLAGEGQVEIEGELTAVRPGTVIYVPKHAAHRFSEHEEGLTLLVVFAPPCSGRGGSTA